MESTKKIVNNCINGTCSHCGECCTDFIPLTQKEYTILKNYIKEHNIELTNWDIYNAMTQKTDVHVLCPFLDKDTKLCKVYEVRPKICRTFKCCKKADVLFKERDTILKSAKYNKMSNTGHLTNVYSLYELFGTGKEKGRTISLLANIIASDHDHKVSIESLLKVFKAFGREDLTTNDIFIYLNKEESTDEE